MARAYMETPVSGPNAELGRGVYSLTSALKYRMINQCGKTLIVGNTAMVDFTGRSSNATLDGDGTITDFLRRIVEPVTATTTSGMLGVIVDLLGNGGVDGTEVVVQFRGICSAYAYGTSGVTAGVELKTNAGESVFDRNAGSANNSYAYSLGATSGSAVNEGTAELIDVLLIGPWGGGI